MANAKCSCGGNLYYDNCSNSYVCELCGKQYNVFPANSNQPNNPNNSVGGNSNVGGGNNTPYFNQSKTPKISWDTLKKILVISLLLLISLAVIGGFIAVFILLKEYIKWMIGGLILGTVCTVKILLRRTKFAFDIAFDSVLFALSLLFYFIESLKFYGIALSFALFVSGFVMFFIYLVNDEKKNGVCTCSLCAIIPLFFILFSFEFPLLQLPYILGIGVGVSFLILFFSTLHLDEYDVLFVFVAIVLTVTALVLLFISYTTQICGIFLLFAALLIGLIVTCMGRIDEEFSFLSIAVLSVSAFLIFCSLGVFFGSSCYDKPDFSISENKLVYYAGNSETVTVPDNVTTINNSAFERKLPQKHMKEIILHNKILSIGDNAFKNCDALTSVVIPKSIIKISNGTFSSCDVLATVTFEGNIVEIGENAFNSCISLNDINIPQSIQKIGIGAFSSCVSLDSVYIPDNIKEIDGSAFSYCSNLSEIYIGKNLDKLGVSVFSGISNLTIYFGGTEEEWNNIQKAQETLEDGTSLSWNSGLYNYEIIFEADGLGSNK